MFPEHRDRIASVLMTYARDEDAEVCSSAAEAIGNLDIRITDRAIFRRLLESLKQSDWQLRARAVEALAALRNSLADDEEDVLGNLFLYLGDSKWYVRACSCEVLGHLADTFLRARPRMIRELMQLLTPSRPELIDAEGYVSAKALRALGKMGLTKAQSTNTIQRIVEFLRSENWREQIAACEALGDIGPDAGNIDGIVVTLLECLSSTVWCVRVNACRTLGRMLPAPLVGTAGMKDLVACLSDEQQPVRNEAAAAVTKLVGDGKSGMRLVVEYQQNLIVAIREGRALGKMRLPRPTPPLFMLTLPKSTMWSNGQGAA